MEVEKVQDGPLKNSEITRFLEASKTSYRTVESILTDKKEPSFQQRTLIDIASEAELRNNLSRQDLDTQEVEEVNKSISSVEEETDHEINAQKIEEEEKALRIIEEKKLQDDKIAQEEKEKTIYEKAFAEGKVASEKETQEKLENGLIALENARQSMLDLSASHFIKLRDKIASQILNLSSERAGIEISNLPDKFFTKIETLLETIGQTTKEPIVFLNPNDLEAIQDTISRQTETLGISFKSREDLLNGDIIIEIGSISVRDKARERSEVSSDSELSNIGERDDNVNTNEQSKTDAPVHDQNNEGAEG
ncbi:MAG: FliH/SctL family protein [Paracoccaceae bacterium]|nr:FliH/SctL family protein [Paracoccaceae bacterium]